MAPLSLLEKTRKINQLLQKTAACLVDFDQMSNVLSNLLEANVYVIDQDGKILGYTLKEDFECEIMKNDVLNKTYFPDEYNEWLLSLKQTKANNTESQGMCAFKKEQKCFFVNKLTCIIPINGAGRRLGTLILARFNVNFTDEDLVLGEYGATVVGMEILRCEASKIEEEARKKAAVQVAVGTLSYSEIEAIIHIFDELEGNEGLLVASKIADRVGITRSVIVNALRKFESAGVIETRSLGMKGTYIHVLNERLIDELDKLKH